MKGDMFPSLVLNRICYMSLVILSGVVDSGLCAGVPVGEVHEESLLWTAEGCRNGGIPLLFI